MTTTQTPISNATSKVYRRATIAALNDTKSKSLQYWRAAARRIFANSPSVNTVECVVSGNKTDSQFISRGEHLAPEGVYVIVASTGGKWGKSRRDFQPIAPRA